MSHPHSVAPELGHGHIWEGVNHNRDTIYPPGHAADKSGGERRLVKRQRQLDAAGGMPGNCNPLTVLPNRG
jgi:hypothetical protein